MAHARLPGPVMNAAHPAEPHTNSGPNASVTLSNDDTNTSSLSQHSGSSPALQTRQERRYDSLEAAQLKEIIRIRRLEDPCPHEITLRCYYIHELEKADECSSFRFLDLPPEMRLMTYRFLLIFDTDENDHNAPIGSVYPSILRTCKLIHEEAKDILYEDNTFTMDSRITELTAPSCDRDIRVHKDRIHADTAFLYKYSSIPQATDTFPNFFTKIKKLTVSLEYCNMYNDIGNVPTCRTPVLNCNLLALASFLMDGHCLQSLHIAVQLPVGLSIRAYETTLYPLRRLRGIKNFTLEGCPFPQIEKQLEADLRLTQPTFNTLRYWKLLDQVMYLHCNSLKHATPDFFSPTDCKNCACGSCECDSCDCEGCCGRVLGGCNCEDCACGDCNCDHPLPEMMQEVQDIDEYISQYDSEGHFTSKGEENFTARLFMLRRYLDSLKADDLGEYIKVLREQYEAMKKCGDGHDEAALLRVLHMEYDGPPFHQIGQQYEEVGEWSEDEH